MAKPVKLKDKQNNQIIPVTRAIAVEMSDGTDMQDTLDSIEDNILEVNYNSGNTALVFGIYIPSIDITPPNIIH